MPSCKHELSYTAPRLHSYTQQRRYNTHQHIYRDQDITQHGCTTTTPTTHSAQPSHLSSSSWNTRSMRGAYSAAGWYRCPPPAASLACAAVDEHVHIRVCGCILGSAAASEQTISQVLCCPATGRSIPSHRVASRLVDDCASPSTVDAAPTRAAAAAHHHCWPRASHPPCGCVWALQCPCHGYPHKTALAAAQSPPPSHARGR